MSILSIAVILVFAAGVFSPIILESSKENWKNELDNRIEKIDSYVLSEINNYQKNIVDQIHSIKSVLKNTTLDLPSSRSLLDTLLNHYSTQDYSLIIKDSEGEFYNWNYESIAGTNFLIDDYYHEGETYFISNTLNEYLTVYDTLLTEKGSFTIALYQLIEKNYRIENKYYIPLSFTDELSEKFNTEFIINYSRTAEPTRDGRKHSIILLNNFNNKIGVATFTKPMREVELQNTTKTFEAVQNGLIIFIVVILGFISFRYFTRLQSYFLRFILAAIYLAALRYILFYLDFSLLFDSWQISNSKYFSSLFGFGIVSSPLELFVTIVFLAVIIITLLRYSIIYYNTNKNEHSTIGFILSLILFIVLYLLTIRGLGASIKSAVFDSSLRYYKEDTLFPNFIEAFMLLNILLVGLLIFIGTLSFLIILYKKLPGKLKNEKGFFLLFALFQIAGIIFDYIQKEPQGTPFFRVLFILFSFLSLYFIVKVRELRFSYFFGYALASSFLVILLLGQYNALIEKESLRKSAYSLTRQNSDLLRFAIYETLVEVITDRETVQSFNSEHINPNSIAFKFWSNSILQKESLGSSISILDNQHDKIGSFNFRFNENLEVDWHTYAKELSDLKEIQIFEESVIYSDNKILRGIATIEDVEGVLGYVTVSVLYDLTSLNLPNAPDFLSSDAGYLNESIDYTKLKIFDFHNGTLINSLSNYSLGENEIISILSADFNEYGEAWLNLQINDEEHLVFVLNREQDEIRRTLAIGLKEKELSWGLFDFFKIFFVHLLIIVSVFFIYLIYKLYSTPEIKFSFATKLLISFILISLIPLILVSFFFRTVTTDKNDYAIEYKLGKRAVNVDEYLNNYLHESSINLNSISEKATRDLGVDFTLFRGNEFVYSTNNQYYAVGLIPRILNPKAYEDLLVKGLTQTITKEKIEGYNFNAFYYKTSLLGEFHVIKITDAFNKIMLPLSGQEVDVYIFVSYSVALIIILLLGFILTNQISKPISQLKNATKSVASGDLHVEVNVSTRDEVSELVDGFNYMVKELKRSQAELAEFERETAWKEMAKQVAHEIKNPLTPMKLSVQQLIAAYNDKSDKFDKLFNKVTRTIINQIETLKNIASEFSSFARMPNPKIETVNLESLLREAVDLFSEEKVSINLESIEKIELNVDKDQLRRVFINLIRNSIQAGANSIKIMISKEAASSIIRIKDNGSGIPLEVKDRIFDNEFSTKTTGMGLGLTMAKKTIENYGGTISIEESTESGTIILINIPVL